MSIRLVLGHAGWMLRHDLGRIAGAALVVFVPPALLVPAVEWLRSQQGEGTPLHRIVLVAVLVGALAAMRALGEILFAGFLELAVGEHRFEGHRPGFREVVTALPWARLIGADLLVVLGVGLLSVVAILPGVVAYFLVALIGPVLVQERRGVLDGLRRSAHLALRWWPYVVGLVVVPLGLEHAIAEAVHHQVHGGGPLVVAGAEWLLGTLVLGAVGVVEVALATEVMARTPDRSGDQGGGATVPA